MDSQLVDQSRDPLLAFASEAPATPTPEREPAFLRIPTPYDGHLSITSVATDQPPSQASGARPLTTVLVVAGVVAGFIGGYVFADRIIAPAAAPAHRVTAPVPVPAPAPAPVAAPVASSEPAAPRTEPSREPTREPSAVKAAQSTDANVAPVPSAPSTTKRASIPASTKRPSTITRPRPAVAPTTALSGAIQIMSRPRDAKVLLDGNVVGLAPLSIPDVPEGLHEVRVELDGFSPWVGSVRVKGGSRARVAASLER
jgi:PEGA domain-containing protein